MAQFHEDFTRQDKEEAATERSLGKVFGVVCALIAGFKLYHGSTGVTGWLIAAAVFWLLAYFWTTPLRPLNFVWMRFAALLYKITNPIIMAVVFYAAILPTGLIMRACGKDPMRRKKDPAAQSYWIVRNPPGPAPETMKNQF